MSCFETFNLSKILARYSGSFVLEIVAWAKTNANPNYPDSSPACFCGAARGSKMALREEQYSYVQNFY